MRKQIALAMILLVLLIMPVSLWLIVQQSFDLSMTQIKSSALQEEAAIARAVTAEIRGSNDSVYRAANMIAQELQAKYGSPQMQLWLLNQETPMAGAVLPEGYASTGLSSVENRSSYLASDNATLYIAHPLTGDITLVAALDVSSVYDLRNKQQTYACIICGLGLLLAGIIAFWISGSLTKPLYALTRSAKALQQGDASIPLPARRDDEIGLLTEAFAHMSDAVQAREKDLADQAQQRQELIDALAHEMRTPLTAIIGSARLLEQDDGTPAIRKRMTNLIVQESNRLAHMDDDLMKLTQMNHDTLDISSFSSYDMAKEALSVYQDIELTGDDTVFTGDRQLLIQMMRNLTTNALRSGTTCPVIVALHHDGFDVVDQGRGMTEDQIAHAFEPFWKADKARTRQNGGAGLGLTLCQRIVQAHQGTLTIRSIVDSGTTVSFRFATPLLLHDGFETANMPTSLLTGGK